MKVLSLALTGLYALLAAGPALAQGGSLFLESAPANRLSLDPPGQTVGELSFETISPDCPKNILAVDFYYPQGLGQAAADKTAKDFVQAAFDRRQKEAPEFCKRGDCGGEDSSCGLWTVEKTFAVHNPSSRFISILFTEEGYTGGAHGNLEYEVLNLAAADGRRLGLTDLFPKPEVSLPKYCAFLKENWNKISGEEPPADCLKAASLEDLGRLVFTPYGAVLLLGPYEFGSYADGSRSLDIASEELKNMGAADLWAD